MPSTILIDIDGVIAPGSDSRPAKPVGDFVEDEVPGFIGRVLILVDRIADLVRISEETGAELVFHTSWETDSANEAFSRYFGRELEALEKSPVRAVWWKLDAVEDALPRWADEGRRVVWLDDMLADENDFGDTWGRLGERAAEAAGVPLLVIAPDERVGLLPEDIAAVEEFLTATGEG